MAPVPVNQRVSGRHRDDDCGLGGGRSVEGGAQVCHSRTLLNDNRPETSGEATGDVGLGEELPSWAR